MIGTISSNNTCFDTIEIRTNIELDERELVAKQPWGYAVPPGYNYKSENFDT